MKRIVRISLIVVLLTAGIALLGCSRTVVYRGDSPGTTITVKTNKPGPPPHAPAHGYRHKHATGVVLVYDSSIGVYVVSGYKNVYYYNSYFYRRHKSKWQWSHGVDGPWLTSYGKNLPRNLQEKVAKHDADDKGNGKDNHKNDGKGNGKDNSKKDDKDNGKGNSKNDDKGNDHKD
jgi:hypothetical protein